jgi:hypothetical protein
MANRTKPYTKKLAVLDIVLLLLTQAGWLVAILIRELYRWEADPK